MQRRSRTLVAVIGWLVVAGVAPFVDSPIAAATPDDPEALYEAAVADDDPILFWRFGQSSATATDQSGNGRLGSLGPGAQHATSAVRTGEGVSVASTAGSPAVVLDENPVPAGADASYTVELWFRPEPPATDQPAEVAPARWLARWGDKGLWALPQMNGLFLDTGAEAQFYPLPISGPTTHRDWIHLAVVHDEAGGRLLVNGHETPGVDAGQAPAPDPQLLPGFLIGELPGTIDEVAVYPSALSRVDLLDHWRAGVAVGAETCLAVDPSPTGLSASVLADDPSELYSFAEIEGSEGPPLSRVVLDRSGNCHHASVTGATEVTPGIDGVGPGARAMSAEGALPLILHLDGRAETAPHTIEVWSKGVVVGVDSGSVVRPGGPLEQRAGVVDGLWHQLVATQDIEGNRLYLDGALVPAGSGLWKAGATEAEKNSLAFLGGAPSSELGMVARFDHSLTAGEIAAHWRVGVDAVGRPCASVADTPLARAVGADEPVVRMSTGEAAPGSTLDLADDSSGGCAVGRYGSAAVASGDDPAVVGGNGSVLVPDGGSALSLPILSELRTVELWFRRDGGDGAGWLVRGDGKGLWTDGERVGFAPLDQNFDLPTLGAAEDLSGDLFDDAWHSVALVTTGSSTTVFIDGVEGPHLAGAFATRSLLIGGLPGRYDEVAGYAGALGAERLLAHVDAARRHATETELAVVPRRWIEGATVSLAAGVASPTTAEVPGGSIVFTDGSTVLDTVGLVDGSAQAVVPSISVGRHRFRARFVPDDDYQASVSPVTSSVAAGSGSVVLAAEEGSAEVGQSIELEVHVGPSVDEPGPATGSVQIREGAVVLAELTLDDDGRANTTLDDLSIGSHEVTASYVGDEHHPAGDSPVIELVITPRATSIHLRGPPIWVHEGEAASDLVVDVETGSDHEPVGAGSVEIVEDSTVLVSAPLSSQGVAALPELELPAGLHHLVVRYTGSGDLGGSDEPWHLVVASPVEVQVEAPESMIGGGARFEVSAQVPGGTPLVAARLRLRESGGGPAMDGSGVISDGVGAFVASGLLGGLHDYDIEVVLDAGSGTACLFDPDRGYACDGYSGAAASASVEQIAAATEVSIGESGADPGRAFLVARVAPADPASAATVTGGTVTFRSDGRVLQSMPVQNGYAQVYPSVRAGVHDITATYSGTDAWSGSEVHETEHFVRRRTFVDAASVPDPIVSGEEAEIVVQVASELAGETPTGSISLSGNGFELADGITDTMDLDDDGRAVFRIVAGSGVPSLTVSYAGDDHQAPAEVTLQPEVVDPGWTVELEVEEAALPAGAVTGFSVTVVDATPDSAVEPVGEVVLHDDQGRDLATGTVVETEDDGTTIFVGDLVGWPGSAIGDRRVMATFNPDGPADPVHSLSVPISVSKAVAGLDVPTSVEITVGESASLEVAVIAMTANHPDDRGAVVVSGDLDDEVEISESGTAAIDLAALPTGIHTLSVGYSGSSFWAPVDAVEVEVDVVGPRIETTISSSPGRPAWVYADEQTGWTVKSTADEFTPEGEVSLRVDGVPREGVVPLDSSGFADLSVGELLPGIHHLRAEFRDPSGTYASAATEWTLRVGSRPTVVATTTSGSVIGGPTSVSIEVDGAGSAPGTIEIVPASGESVVSQRAAPGGDGAYVLEVRSFLAGSATYRARFSPVGSDCLSDPDRGSLCDLVGPGWGTFDVTQEQAPTSMTVHNGPLGMPGRGMVLWAEVRSEVVGTGEVSGGTVEFEVDGVVVGTAVVVEGGATSPVDIAPGTHEVAVRYLGSPAWQPIEVNDDDVVIKALTRVGVTIEEPAEGWKVGEWSEATITVTAEDTDEMPTGAVWLGGQAFTVLDGEPLGSAFGTGPFELDEDGVVVVPVRMSGSGPGFVSADFEETATMRSSTYTSSTVTITGIPTTTALQLEDLDVERGQVVPATVIVSSGPGAPRPSGPVGLFEGEEQVGWLNTSEDGAAGETVITGTLSTGALERGLHTIEARFVAFGSHGRSESAPIDLEVGRDLTTTSVVEAPLGVIEGGSFNIEVAVSSSWWNDRLDHGDVSIVSGDVVVGSGVPDVDGAVTVEVPGLAPGDHVVRARYAGSADEAPSSSEAVTIRVVPSFDLTLDAPASSERLDPVPVTIAASLAPGLALPPAWVRIASSLGWSHDERATALPLEIDLSGVPLGEQELTATICIDPAAGDAPEAFGDCAAEQASLAIDHEVLRAQTTATIPDFTLPYATEDLLVPVDVQHGGSHVSEGTVVIQVDGEDAGSAALEGERALIDVGPIAAGEHVLVARYEGTQHVAPSATAGVDVQISKIPVVASIGALSSPVVAGRDLDLTVGLSASSVNRPSPEGEVSVEERVEDEWVDVDTVELDAGTGQTSIPEPSVGLHRYRVRWGGDDAHEAADEELLVEVRKAYPTVGLAASAVEVEPGGSTELAASVEVEDLSTAEPVGEVVFYDGALPIGTAVLDAGVGELEVEALALGVHHFRATYLGSGLVAGGQSLIVDVQVREVPSIALSAADTSVYGQTVPVKVTASGPAGGAQVPTGTVALLVGGVEVARRDLGASGATPSVDLAFGAPGTKELTATYLGDAIFQSAEAAVDHVVGKASPSVRLSTAASVGSQAPLQTMVSVVAIGPGAGVPSGSVTFHAGAMTRTVALGEGATASATFEDGFDVEDVAVWVTYDGDANFKTGRSPSQLVRVRPPTTTELTVSNATPSLGQVITVHARSVTGGVGATTGAITFLDGDEALGHVEVDLNGRASLDVATLDAGTHHLVARYDGASSFAPSESAHDVAVQKAVPTVAAVLAPSPLYSGQSLRASVVVASPVPSWMPDGTVVVKEAGAPLGTATLDEEGRAVVTLSGLAVGPHELTFGYLGDHDLAPASAAPALVTVLRSPTSVAVASSVHPAAFGADVAFTADVSTSVGGGVASGLVELRDGAELLGSTALDSTGRAVFHIGDLGLGSHEITAVFFGSSTHEGSSSAVLAQRIGRSVEVDLEVAPGQDLTYGDPVGLHVEVVPSVSGGPVATGSVEILSSEGVVGSVVLLADGTADISPVVNLAGDVDLRARYLGDSHYGSAGSAAQGVSIAKRLATVAATARETSGLGRSTPVHVTVSSVPAGFASAKGTVEVLNGSTVVGTASLEGGQADVAVAGLALGGHDLHVRYLGSSAYLAASGEATLAHEVVSRIVPHIEVSATRVIEGSTVTFDADETEGPVDAHSWTFGDGDVGGGESVAHTFDRPGTYTVVLTAAERALDPDQREFASATVVVVADVPVAAVAGPNQTVEEDQPVRFDGTRSSPKAGLQFTWQFGDAEDPTATSSSSTPTHTYAVPGIYTVTLTVEGVDVSATATLTVEVLDEELDDGLFVTVIDKATQQPVSGAQVLVENPMDGRFEDQTNDQGGARLRGLANGPYSVYAIAPGYRPGIATTVQQDSTGHATVQLVRGALVDSAVSTRVVDPSELPALGIDADDEDNSHVTEIGIHIEVAGPSGSPVDETVRVLQNGHGECLKGCGGRTIGGDRVMIGQELNVITVMVIGGHAKYLKEFFSVDLTVVNLTLPNFSFTGGAASIDLPPGLSLPALSDGPQPGEVTVPFIQGRHSFHHGWIVRGDDNGTHQLSTAFTALLQPFGTSVRASSGETSIEVAGGDALAFDAVVDESSWILDREVPFDDSEAATQESAPDVLQERLIDPFHVQRFIVRNTSDATLRNVVVDLAPYLAGPGFLSAPYSKTKWRWDQIPAHGSVEIDPLTVVPLLTDSFGEDPGSLVAEPGGSTHHADGVVRAVDLFESMLRVDGDQRSVDTFTAAPLRPPATRRLRTVRGPGAMAGQFNVGWEEVGGQTELWASSGPGHPFEPKLDVTGTNVVSVPAAGAAAGTPGLVALVTIEDGERTLRHNALATSAETESGYRILTMDYLCPARLVIVASGPQVDFIDLKIDGEAQRIDVVASEQRDGVSIYSIPGSIIFPGGERYESDISATLDTRDVPGMGSERVDIVAHGCDTHVAVDEAERKEREQRGKKCVDFNTGTLDVSGESLPTSACEADPVNQLTGNLISSVVDLEIAGPGPGFAFERTYNSNDATVGPLGRGWSHPYATKLVFRSGGLVTFVGPDGAQVDYGLAEDGSYPALSSTTMSLAKRAYGPLDPDGGLGWDATTLAGLRYHFRDDGRLQWVHDRSGEGPSLAYDGAGKLQTVSYAGRTVAFAWLNGKIRTVTATGGGLNKTLLFTYNGDLLVSAKNPANEVTTYGYDSAQRLTTLRNNDGDTTTTSYRADGRVDTQRDPEDGLTTFGWDEPSRTATMTDPGMHTWRQKYDAAGRMTEQIDPLERSRVLGYYESGLVAVERVAGTEVSYQYDERGNMTLRRTPVPGGVDETWTYRTDNQVATYSDVTGRQTTFHYDTNGRLTVLDGPGSDKTVTRFDARGLVTWVCQGSVCADDPQDLDGDGATRFRYDAYGRVTSKRTPGGSETITEYDDAGRRTHQYDPRVGATTPNRDLYRTTTKVDQVGRAERVDRPGGNYLITTWSARGKAKTTLDGLGNSTALTYFRTGELKTVSVNQRLDTTHAYYPDGKLRSETKRVYTPGDAAPPQDLTTSFTYNAAGDVETVTDPVGNAAVDRFSHTTRYTYFPVTGLVKSVTSPENATTRFTYDAVNRQRTVDDGAGTTTIDYWPDGKLKRQRDPDGFTRSWSYDEANRLESETDELGNPTRYAYDERGDLRTATTVDGATLYERDADGAVWAVTDPRGTATAGEDDYRTVFTHDAAGNTLTERDPLGQTSTYTYDPAGNRLTATDPLTRTTTWTYELGARVKTVTKPQNPGEQFPPKTTYTYLDGGTTLRTAYPAYGTLVEKRRTDGQLSSSTRAGGSVSYTTQYGYDAAARLSTRTDPGLVAPKTTTFTYGRLQGEDGEMWSSVRSEDAAHRVSQTVTDPRGRVRTEIGLFGARTDTSYTPAGRVLSVRGPQPALGGRPIEVFDRAIVPLDGQYALRTVRTDAAQKAWAMITDWAGRPRSSTTPEGRTATAEYDAVGNVLTSDAPGDVGISQSWSARNELLTRQQSGQGPEVRAYDIAGQLESVTAPGGGTTSFVRDARGNVKEAHGPGGAIDLWEYNQADFNTKHTDGLARRTYFNAGDGIGRLSEVTTPLEVVSFQRDPEGRVRQRSAVRGSASSVETSTYDESGLLTGTTSPGGNTSYVRNYENQILTTTATGPNGTVAYRTAPNGQRTSMTQPGGTTTSYGYWSTGTLRTTKVSTPSSPATTTTLHYDEDGLLTREEVDGRLRRLQVLDDDTGLVERYEDHARPGDPWTEDLDYEHGKVTQRAVTRPDGSGFTTSYDYEADSGQLERSEEVSPAGSDVREYAYNDDGSVDWTKHNGVSTDFSYDLAHQLKSATTGTTVRTFTYDGVGRRLTDKVPGGRQVTLSYDVFGRQSGASVTDPALGTGTESLAYDAEGRLTSIDGTGAFAGAAAHPVWDTQTAVPQVIDMGRPDAPMTMSYLGSRRIDIRAGSTDTAPAYDSLGNPFRMQQSDDPSLRGQSYGPFGESTRQGSTLGVGFQGELWQPDGLVHLRARNYDPSTMSFTSRDPLPSVVGSNTFGNPYAYADNDPINRQDPLGLRGEVKKGCTKSGSLINSANAFAKDHLGLTCMWDDALIRDMTKDWAKNLMVGVWDVVSTVASSTVHSIKNELMKQACTTMGNARCVLEANKEQGEGLVNAVKGIVMGEVACHTALTSGFNDYSTWGEKRSAAATCGRHQGRIAATVAIAYVTDLLGRAVVDGIASAFAARAAKAAESAGGAASTVARTTTALEEGATSARTATSAVESAEQGASAATGISRATGAVDDAAAVAGVADDASGLTSSTNTPRASGVADDSLPSTVRHYTTNEAAVPISKGGYIRPSAQSGRTWVSPDEYLSGATAQERLALPRTPDGYYEIPTCRVQCPSAPSPVQPANRQPGGGIEITTEYPIDVGDLPFHPFR
jgi:RHS repeat-associated protein